MCYPQVLIVILWLAMTSSASDEEEHKLRVERQINALPLVYPIGGGTYKLIVGFFAPIKVEDDINVAFLVNFQYQYAQIANNSDLSQYYLIKTVSREQREAEVDERKYERLTFYRSVADILRSRGMESDECVFRAICEAAQYPVEDEGLTGAILHILLTPDYGKSPFDVKDQELEDLMSPYNDAAEAGRQMFDCASIYPECPEGQGIMEMFSTLIEE